VTVQRLGERLQPEAGVGEDPDRALLAGVGVNDVPA
jgi:hypothetical protein